MLLFYFASSAAFFCLFQLVTWSGSKFSFRSERVSKAPPAGVALSIKPSHAWFEFGEIVLEPALKKSPVIPPWRLRFPRRADFVEGAGDS